MEASIVDDLVKSHEFNIKQHQNHRYQGQAGLSTSALAPKFTLVSSNLKQYEDAFYPFISLILSVSSGTKSRISSTIPTSAI